MCNLSWMVSLQQAIRQTHKTERRIAIVGMGHELRGDDAAGLLVVRKLPVPNAHWLVIDAGPAPENFTGKLRAFAPSFLLLVDAVHMNEPPGTIRLLALHELEHYSIATHALSPHLWVTQLRMELPCPIRLLGIQVERVSIGIGLSSAVQASVEQIAQILENELLMTPGKHDVLTVNAHL